MNYFNTFDLSSYKQILSERVLNQDIVCDEAGVSYYDIPASFDIETSSFYQNNEKKAVMYIWQFGINGAVFFGRTWQEFINLINNISEFLKLNDKKRLIVYVHNLGYEFQFMRKWFIWSKVFAIDERKPVYALTENGVEFRCSYILSGYSLAQLGRNLQTYKIDKMVGDLDYKKLRTPLTTLTEKELKYCENDVRVVMSYIQEQIEIYGNITRLQLTKTGYVRKFCRDKCFFDNNSHKKNNYKFIKYKNLMKSLTLTPSEYEQLKRGFQGGFTHSNAFYNNEINKNVHSFDFTSSYPAVMVCEQFPMSKGRLIKINTFNEFYYYLNNYCCLFDCEFKNIERVIDFESYISASRCWNCEGVCEDNGRVVEAKSIRITLTEQDFKIIKKVYTWEKIKIQNFRIYKKGYLPHDLIKAILELYQKKTTLKDVEGREVEYLLNKEMINSVYGMCVTDIVRDEQVYDGENWSKNLSDLNESIKEYNKSKKRFLSYAWGVWVTAYARRNLWSGIFELKDDYIYSDTDSVKFLNYDNHKKYFDDYNNIVVEKLKKACKYHKIKFDLVAPKTITGKIKTLGVWDDEGQYDFFKTLGAKRYMTYKNKELSMTVSGVNKKSAIPYLLKICNNDYMKVFKIFDDGLKIPASDGDSCPTGKQTHTYIDEEIEGNVKDFQGNYYNYYEKSFIHLENAEYSLSLSDKYIDFIKNIKEYIK